MDIREQYRASVEKWRRAMPPCLEPFYEKDLQYGIARDKTAILQVLESAYPDIGDRAVAIFRWYGNGEDQWASGLRLMNETVVEDLLTALPIDALVQAVMSRNLAPDEIDGAARYFITKKQSRENLPDELRLKLLDYCASTDDHAKIARARNVLDIELQQALASAETDTSLKPLTTALTQFSGQLFTSIWKENSNVNLLISPYTIALALSLIYNGVRGTTADEIAQVLGITELELGDFNQLQLLLQEILEVLDTQVELKIADGLWVKENISLSNDFTQCVQKYFHAEARPIDFKEASAPQVINKWVSEKTRGGISKVLESIDPETLMVLINTLYMRAMWTNKFEPEETKEGDFTLLDGSQKQYPMMTGEVGGNYIRTDKFEAIRLPYGRRSVSMVIFLPNPPYTLHDFQAEFSVENWNEWMQQLDLNRSFGSITMPRFKFEYAIELSEAIKSLGINRIFDYEHADFSAMSDRLPYPYISQFLHKTFIEVNEDGTKADAATVVLIGAGGKLTPAFDMVVNRAFFFAIRDDKTDLILFMGCVVEPL